MPDTRARRPTPGSKHPFTSGLAVPDFAALHSVGLDPVGQVMAAVAVHLGNVPYPCRVLQGTYRDGRRALLRTNSYWRDDRTIDFLGLTRELRAARDEVLRRLVAACREVRGDGVVDVRVEQGFEDEKVGRLVQRRQLLRLRVTGTAVRARTRTRPAEPFTCDLAGSDVALLMRSGHVPTRIAWGFGAAMRHGPVQSPGEWGNQYTGRAEMRGATSLVSGARTLARADLGTQAAGLQVLRTSTLAVWETEPAEGHRHTFALATMVGSGFVRFGPPTTLPALAVLPLR